MDIKEQIETIATKHHAPVNIARLVLEIPKLKEALILLDLKNQGKLVKLADNQTLSKSPYLDRSLKAWDESKHSIYERLDKVYAEAQGDMWKENWKRVETL
jgi:hypothetical protein